MLFVENRPSLRLDNPFLLGRQGWQLRRKIFLYFPNTPIVIDVFRIEVVR